MKIWSFQRDAVVKRLRAGARLEVSWDQIWHEDKIRYARMAHVMRKKGLPLHEAPVWAWLGEAREETICTVGRELLNDAEIASGIQVLTLEVPSGLAFLSDYQKWQDFFLADVRTHAEGPSAWESGWREDETREPERPIQVTMPFLLPGWLCASSTLPPCLLATSTHRRR